MPGNEYRDDHGHFTTKENDNGPCRHDSSSGNDIIYSDNLIKENQTTLSETEKKYLENVNANANSEAIDVLNSLPPVKIRYGTPADETDTTCYDHEFKTIIVKKGDTSMFSEKEEGTSYYAKGEIYFHENGHYVDNKLSREISNGILYASSSFVSPKFGVTLHDMVRKEKSRIKRADGVKMSILLDYEFIDKFTDDKTIKDICGFYKKYVDDAIEYANNRLVAPFGISKKFSGNFVLGHTDDMTEFKDEAIEYINNKIRFFFSKEDIQKYNNSTGVRMKAMYYGRQKYSIISDALSSTRAYTQTKGIAHIGHSATYYYDRILYGLGTEFFANYFSAWSRNDKEQMEVTKRFMPNSCEIFDEMIKAYKDKKGGK